MKAAVLFRINEARRYRLADINGGFRRMMAGEVVRGVIGLD